MSGGHDDGHGHTKKVEKPSPKLPLKPIFIICIVVGLCIWAGWCTMQGAKSTNGSVQTGPAQQPVQAAPVATDPCSMNPAVTVSARPAGTTPEWVSIPMGRCEAVPVTPGMGISYTRVCLDVNRQTDTTGLCPGGAYAVGYQSTSSATVQVTTRFRHNP
jgi:hypothetical protein